ncbi:MAG: hypothetical protein EOT05_03880 [Candidatus Microsaccharimonas sossegonensis]|uniref:Uncharacterized protein n=1 Tax=Candidatus Microsaccharimonas sossegonensis TaxID=2506948 RepID=A0A4V1J7J0_9BACT|nr:MAG: hypothetical protein EOT05_03880 [Candidatus Microsaccharimonas sossegonensis]
MARLVSKTGLFVAIVVVGIVLVVIGAVLLTKKPQDTAKTNPTDTTKNAPTTKNNPTETDAANVSASATQASATSVDPATLTSIDISPLGIAVFYSKGTPGFTFTVLKTANQTQYVEFASSNLIGTKCTNDQGAFASIIKNPSSTETQTTSQTVTLGNDTYGLSLSSAGCTSNVDLLNQYQDGFKTGFSRLKAI